MVFSLTTDDGCAMTYATPDANDILDFEDYITGKYGDQGGFTQGDSACYSIGFTKMIDTIIFHGAPVSIYTN